MIYFPDAWWVGEPYFPDVWWGELGSAVPSDRRVLAVRREGEAVAVSGGGTVTATAAASTVSVIGGDDVVLSVSPENEASIL